MFCSYVLFTCNFENHSIAYERSGGNLSGHSIFLNSKTRYQSFIERNNINRSKKTTEKFENKILKQIDLLLLLNKNSNNEYNELSIISAYESSENYN